MSATDVIIRLMKKEPGQWAYYAGTDDHTAPPRWLHPKTGIVLRHGYVNLVLCMGWTPEPPFQCNSAWEFRKMQRAVAALEERAAKDVVLGSRTKRLGPPSGNPVVG